MKWSELWQVVGGEAVFPTGFLLVGRVSPAQIRLQLSRWVKSGRLIKLRRGLYAFAPGWRKVEPHPFGVANAMQRGSYVSLQSALAFHGFIPEYVPVVTSVGPGRPETVSNSLGRFQFQHLAGRLVYGYGEIPLGQGQKAFIASPEKAILDLLHLTPFADSPSYIRELRLHDPGTFDPVELGALARRSGKAKLVRGAELVTTWLSADEAESR